MAKIEKFNHILTGFLTSVLGTVSMFGVTIYLTRTVDQDVYGEFRLAFSFISLMVVLLLMGRDNGVVYFAQKGAVTKEQKHKIISQESYYTLIVFLLGILILFLFREPLLKQVFNNNISEKNFSIALLMLPLWGWFNMGIAALRVKNFINYSFTLSNLTQRLIRVPFFIILVFIEESFLSLTFSMILSQVVLLVIMIKKVPWIAKFKNINLKDFFLRFKYSIQLGLSSIIFVVLSKIDIIMIGKFWSTSEVAIYDVCVMLSMVVLFPYTALVKASEPVVKNILKEKQKMLGYQNNLKLAISIASIVVLAFITNTDLILSIFGNEYVEGNQALVVLGTGYLIVCFLGSPIEFLNMTGHVKKSLITLVFSLILNMVLNYFFIPRYGLVGAAYATVFSLVFSKIIALFLVRRYIDIGIVNKEVFLSVIPFFLSLLIFTLLKNSFMLETIFIKILIGILLIIMCVLLNYLFDKNLRNKINSFF